VSSYSQGTETRIELSYINAVKVVEILDQQILQYSPEKMFIHFVNAEQAARKIKPATFSFNLPIPKCMFSLHSFSVLFC
jgi:hypothetical protein